MTLLTLALCLPGMANWCLFSPDCFGYLDMARHLLETGGFPPSQFMLPPGFPVVVAPLLWFGDLPLLALRVLLAACWAGTAALTYLLHRAELGPRRAWLAGLFVATSPVLLHSTLMPLSEPVFTVLTLLVLLIMVAWWRKPVRSGWLVALGGLLTAAACMVRSMGVVLLPIMALALLRHRREPVARRTRRLGVFVLCTLAPLIAWQVRQSHYPAAQTYGRIWTTAREAEATSATGLALQIERFQKFAPSRLESIKEAMLPKDLAWRAFNPPWDQPTTWFIGGVFVVVAVVRLVRLSSPVDLYVLLTLFVLSLWPWNEGVRLVAPLIPVFVGYPLWFGQIIWRGAHDMPWLRSAAIAALLVWLMLQAAGVAVEQSRLPSLEAKARHRLSTMATIAAWHEAHTPPNAPWVGVTPDADESKVVLLGAAYLARRPITTVDVRGQSACAPGLPDGGRAFVHASLADFVQNRWGHIPIGQESGFVVFEQPGHH